MCFFICSFFLTSLYLPFPLFSHSLFLASLLSYVFVWVKFLFPLFFLWFLLSPGLLPSFLSQALSFSGTVCPRSLLYNSYQLKWANTSWTHSISKLWCTQFLIFMLCRKHRGLPDHLAGGAGQVALRLPQGWSSFYNCWPLVPSLFLYLLMYLHKLYLRVESVVLCCC